VLTLYKFYWDCGRQGNLEGVFLATPEDIEYAIGKRIYFGEALGKHSEIFGTLERADITFVSDDPKVIKIIQDNDLCIGWNPLDYLEE
jgi:hypothetical protein